MEEKEILEKRIIEYLVAGMNIPLGLEERWFELTGSWYKPNLFIRKMYKVITGKNYDYNNRR